MLMIILKRWREAFLKARMTVCACSKIFTRKLDCLIILCCSPICNIYFIGREVGCLGHRSITGQHWTNNHAYAHWYRSILERPIHLTVIGLDYKKEYLERWFSSFKQKISLGVQHLILITVQCSKCIMLKVYLFASLLFITKAQNCSLHIC